MLEPAVDAGDVVIFHADSRDAWRHLEPASVDAIVTSPPYWGLRDYGAGVWHGGADDCDHGQDAELVRRQRSIESSTLDGGKRPETMGGAIRRRDVCPLCSAVYVDDQIGMEPTPAEYVTELADLLDGYGRRVMRDDGSLWVNLGDVYSSSGPTGSIGSTAVVGATRAGVQYPDRVAGDHPPKCLLLLPARFALAMVERGWIVRNEVIWHKTNGMPSSVTDRLAVKHETLWHLVRQPRYRYDLDAIREAPAPDSIARAGRAHTEPSADSIVAQLGRPHAGGPSVHELGANPGDVWPMAVARFPGAHFATYPPELIRRPILATVRQGETVLDPFFGAGTTGVMARRLGRRAIGVELVAANVQLAGDRFRQATLGV